MALLKVFSNYTSVTFFVGNREMAGIDLQERTKIKSRSDRFENYSVTVCLMYDLYTKYCGSSAGVYEQEFKIIYFSMLSFKAWLDLYFPNIYR